MGDFTVSLGVISTICHFLAELQMNSNIYCLVFVSLVWPLVAMAAPVNRLSTF